jgi:hypothetical protein
MKIPVAMSYHFELLPDRVAPDHYEVHGPSGELVAAGTPDQAPVIQSWMILAAWAHAQLKGDTEKLAEVLAGGHIEESNLTLQRKVNPNGGPNRQQRRHPGNLHVIGSGQPDT